MENALTSILTNIGTFFTQAITWMGDVLEVVVSEPALLIMVIAMPICGFKICESTLNRVKTVKLSLRQYRAKLHSNVLKVQRLLHTVLLLGL